MTSHPVSTLLITVPHNTGLYSAWNKYSLPLGFSTFLVLGLGTKIYRSVIFTIDIHNLIHIWRRKLGPDQYGIFGTVTDTVKKKKEQRCLKKNTIKISKQ